jgi:flagellar hook-associated protein 1 FlgK
MSLLGALNVGQSALSVAQSAIQTTGNNIANSSDPNYAREVATVTPAQSEEVQPGVYIGDGVDLSGVSRQVDEALNARLRSSQSDYNSASTQENWLSQIESSFDALSGNDLSSTLGTFLNDWSTLANNPQDTAQRQVVIQDGQNVAQSAQALYTGLSGIQGQINDDISSVGTQADQLATQIAQLNTQITASQGPNGGGDDSLQDQRDADLSQLSTLIGIQTSAGDNGQINVYVGSQPLVYDGTSAGITTANDTVDGELVTTLQFKNGNGNIPVSGGQLGGLVGAQTQVNTTMGQVNTMVHNLIGAVNGLHSSGQGTDGFTSVTSTNAVDDPTVALNSAAAGLTYAPNTGSFVVHVTNTASGQSTSTLVHVQLSGQPGDTTLNSLAASLSAIPSVSATVNAGQLTITAASGSQISFSQDTSGVLSALGLNTFFTGTDATDIGVNQTLQADPGLLAAAKNGDPGDNQTALAIAALGSTPVTGLGGQTLDQAYQSAVNQVASATSGSQTQASAAQAVQETLTNQQQAVSGVSLDTETVNLIAQQRAFEGASRLIYEVDQMYDELMNMVQ